MLYHPEMGEKPAPRLFNSSHNFKDSYSLSWAADRDAEARAKLLELRITPKKNTADRQAIELGMVGEWDAATRLGKPVYHCLITGAAHTKLFDADLVAHEALLD